MNGASTQPSTEDHEKVSAILTVLRQSKGLDWEEAHLDDFLMRYSHAYQFKEVKRFRSLFRVLVEERLLNR